MPNITTPANIPAAARPKIAAVLKRHGRTLLGDKWPEDVDPENLTAAQVGQLFEQATRELWRQQIVAIEANEAAEAARQSAIEAAATDPFEGTPAPVARTTKADTKPDAET